MGRSGAHLFLVFTLLSISSLAFSGAAGSFSECYLTLKPYSFWNSQSYLLGNPFITPGAGFFSHTNIYDTSFDSAEQSLGIQNIQVAGPERLGADLSSTGESLSSARSSLSKAKASSATAHSLSLAAQKELNERPGMKWVLCFDVSAYKLVSPVPSVCTYAYNYEPAYWGVLSNSADAFSSAESAAYAVAQKMDEIHGNLALAGAGSENYTGAAKDPFFEANAYLSSSGKCQQDLQSANAIITYFESSPILPDFRSVGFAAHLQRIADDSSDSSIMKMAGTYASLQAAFSAMENEWKIEQKHAQDSQKTLAEKIKETESDNLWKLAMFTSEPTASAAEARKGGSQAYSDFVDIYAQQDLADEYLKNANAEHGANTQDYLANSLSFATASNAISTHALNSLESIRAEAASEVESEKSLASGLISKANAKVSGASSSFADAQALQEANDLLTQAQASYDSAAFLPSLGGQFEAYSNAAKFAQQALDVSATGGSRDLKQQISDQLAAFKKFLSQAKGWNLVDVSYATSHLTAYETAMGNAPSANTLLAIGKAADADRQSILNDINVQYSDLGVRYTAAREKVLALRTQDSSFLSPQFDRIVPYFPASKFNAELSIAHYSEIMSALNAVDERAISQSKSYLSALLTKNSRTSALSDTPVLGFQTRYAVTIYTSNPSALSYSGPVQFSTFTDNQIFSSDFTGGDTISDAFSTSIGASAASAKSIRNPGQYQTAIEVPAVSANSYLTFNFEGTNSPAQITSSSIGCTDASSIGAQASGEVGFFTTRKLEKLIFSIPALQSSADSYALYSGRHYALQPTYASGGESALQGEVTNVAAGANRATVSYRLTSPFIVSQGIRAYESTGIGAKKATFQIDVMDTAIDCGTARVSWREPFKGISSLLVTPLAQEKISQPRAVESANGTDVSFTFSPLLAGEDASFVVTYTISDTTQALTDALSQAQQQVNSYGRDRDKISLLQAQALAAQGKSDEALAILSKMLAEGSQIIVSYADYQDFQTTMANAKSILTDATAVQMQLSDENATETASGLSTITSKLESALSSASSEAESKGYSSGLASLRKAVSDFRSSLASFAWSASSSAADNYAKIRKSATPTASMSGFASDTALSSTQAAISTSQKEYSKGKYLQSIIYS
ncbi:MAG: hypothetical protein NTV88_00670, partial [Candidatus Micrarchaeota archaeon]|nr:hypothetical protein [Candidatus Micrarchaeota archaeon]